ncbi:hypothetical protein NLX86_09495 [Streptomyces sp. A3M-1-3]|uniref:hypothetical protein n=1 Tax=Streptomyces sp. A3M-1-3 TaxID=2962044 RepID=UPI0020B736B3|nr:hypothetical protein [Streptomyces sp. A3M-1-3]MCP3818341.1 hypothetical protein [Streptomyces sp. A3M-1-3]
MNSQPTPVPVVAAALDHPPTLMGHRRLVRRRQLELLAVICVPVSALVAALRYPASDWLISIAAVTGVLAVTVAPLAAIGLASTTRSRRILRHYPWRAFTCTLLEPLGEGHELHIALRSDQGREVRLQPIPFRCNVLRHAKGHPDTIWFAGDLECGGVVSPVGGHYPVRVIRYPRNTALSLLGTDSGALTEKAGLARNGKYRRLSY